MEYTTLGDTGATVSRLALGCMSFGSEHEWMLDEEEGRELIERAIDLGITFFDTANVYSNGESEAILGDVLAEYDRDRFTVATKVYGEMDESNPNSGGLSRKAIEQDRRTEQPRSARDGHGRPVSDPPVGLRHADRGDDAVRARRRRVRRGKVRYLGASSMWAHQFAEALHTSDREGYERFVTMQNLYNLAYREEERELVPSQQREESGCSRGARSARGTSRAPSRTTRRPAGNTRRRRSGVRTARAAAGDQPPDRRVGRREGREDGPSRSAGWPARKSSSRAIVGTSSVEHLEDAVEALDVDLGLGRGVAGGAVRGRSASPVTRRPERP